MKFYILILLLLSCGKEIPSYNNQFSDQLNLDNTVKTEGIVEVTTDWDGKRQEQIEIGTITDLKEHFYKLISVNKKFLSKKNDHDERMKIFIKKPLTYFDYLKPDKEYDISIRLTTIPDKNYNLIFVSPNEERVFGHVKHDNIIKMLGTDLTSLLNHESYLALSEAIDPHLRLNDNYYRIHFHHHNSQIFYVSRNASFESFLEKNKIEHARNIEEINLLTIEEFKSFKSWWYRELPSGDYVLIYDDIKNIHKHYINHLVKFPFSISRKEGKGSSHSIYADNGSRILLRVTGKKIIRKFDTRTEKYRLLNGHCLWFERKISGQIEETLTSDDFQNLVFNNDQAEKLNHLETTSGETEVLYRITKKGTALNLEIGDLNNLMVLGFFRYECKGKPVPYKLSTNKISPEKLFELKGEAFVEMKRFSF